MRIKNLKLLLLGYSLIIGFIFLLNSNISYNVNITPGHGDIPSHWQNNYSDLNEIQYQEIIKKLDVKNILSSSSGDLESTQYLGMPKSILNISYGMLILWTVLFILRIEYIRKEGKG